MKKIIFALLMPSICYSQQITSDTFFVQKINNIFYLKKIQYYDDSTKIENYEILGDSILALKIITNRSENFSNKISEYARGYILRNNINKLINQNNNLHQQISQRPVYTSTALRDSTAFLGTWNLNFKGEIILGEIQLNNNNRLIFNPDNGKVYTISTNLLLSTFTNQISFSFNGVKYDLYKFANGKFSTVEGDVKLIKKE